jgi:hypothetical protein
MPQRNAITLLVYKRTNITIAAVQVRFLASHYSYAQQALILHIFQQTPYTLLVACNPMTSVSQAVFAITKVVNMSTEVAALINIGKTQRVQQFVPEISGLLQRGKHSYSVMLRRHFAANAVYQKATAAMMQPPNSVSGQLYRTMSSRSCNSIQAMQILVSRMQRRRMEPIFPAQRTVQMNVRINRKTRACPLRQ